MEDEGEVCKQSSSSMSARCPCQRRVCTSGSTSGCALSPPRCASVCDAFMVTDSFHLSRPFTLKRQLPVKERKKKEKLFGQLLFIASRSCC